MISPSAANPGGWRARIRSVLTDVDALDLQTSLAVLQSVMLPSSQSQVVCALAVVWGFTAATRRRRAHGGRGEGTAVQRSEPTSAEEVPGAECDASDGAGAAESR
ncbi:hypothetical protein AB0K00_09680 [Dactylosporangium sp. NPDC049525]|uniref:hypothetical protein n=1 Tax=Dactylosporangium sp. NPDC049525 TaxID=3154730 RepID=UPI003436AEC1